MQRLEREMAHSEKKSHLYADARRRDFIYFTLKQFEFVNHKFYIVKRTARPVTQSGCQRGEDRIMSECSHVRRAANGGLTARMGGKVNDTCP